METDEIRTVKKSPLLLIIVILEILIIFAILLFAGYLGLKIIRYNTLSGLTNSAYNTATPSSDCPAGQKGASTQGSYKIEGKEKITVDGKLLDLCCGSAVSGSTQNKVCSDKSNKYTVIYTKTNGKYVLASETYPKDGKVCMKYYNGSATAGEMCL